MCENSFSHMSSRHLSSRSSLYISLPIGNDNIDTFTRSSKNHLHIIIQTKCKMDHDLYFTRAEAARVSNEETTDTIIIRDALASEGYGCSVTMHPQNLSMVIAKD